MGLGSFAGGIASGYTALEDAKAKLKKKDKNPSASEAAIKTNEQNTAMRGDPNSNVENEYYADGGVVGGRDHMGKQRERQYDPHPRHYGKKNCL